MAQVEEKPAWKCERCLWIITGKQGGEIPHHAQACPFYDTGDDPEPDEVQIGGAMANEEAESG
jgi:hypothetical protein